MARALEGTWTTTASGRPSYEVLEANARLIEHVVNGVPAIGFEIVLPPLPGLDTVIARLQRGGALVHVGWDIWSGLFVFAEAPDGDAAARDVADWLAPLLASLGHLARER